MCLQTLVILVSLSVITSPWVYVNYFNDNKVRDAVLPEEMPLGACVRKLKSCLSYVHCHLRRLVWLWQTELLPWWEITEGWQAPLHPQSHAVLHPPKAQCRSKRSHSPDFLWGEVPYSRGSWPFHFHLIALPCIPIVSLVIFQNKMPMMTGVKKKHVFEKITHLWKYNKTMKWHYKSLEYNLNLLSINP